MINQTGPPEQLSQRERSAGQRFFRQYISLNGITVAFLMNDILILYGIRNGLTDPQIAVLASFMHLAMPFMILGKVMIPRFGLSKTWAAAWFSRYLFGSVLIFAPLVGRIAPQGAVVAVILFGAFGFAVCRSIGLTANSPLIGEITNNRDRGRFISGNWMYAQATNFLSMTVVILVMRFYSQVWVYQVLIGLGCVIGFYSSLLLIRIPETEAPRTSARKPMLESLKISFRRSRYRRTLIAWAAGFSAYVLVVPFSIILIKNGYGLSDHTALSFSLLLLVGGISAALINSGISDRVGPRPLLIIYIFGFFIVSGYWIISPSVFQPVIAGGIFFLAGFMKTGLNVGISHYFLSAVDIQDRVGISMFARMFSGAVAGLAGSVGGGTILKILQSSGLSGLPLYRSYFLVIFILLIPLTVLMIRLEPLKEWPVRNVLGLLFSMRDIKALYVMNRLEQSHDSLEEVVHAQQLKQLASTLSEPSLRHLLDSHRLPVRVHAMHALREINFGEKTAQALIHELRCGEFTSGWNAAEILGEHNITAAVPELRKSLESEDPFLAGKAMVALARLGDTQSFSRIEELFRNSENPRIIIHGANAFEQLNDPSRIPGILDKVYNQALHPKVADELLSSVAALCGCDQEFYNFLREYSIDPDQGFTLLQMDLRRLTGRVFLKPSDLGSLGPAELLLSTTSFSNHEPWFRYLSEYLRMHEFKPQGDDLRLKFLACTAVLMNKIRDKDGDGGDVIVGD